MKTEMKENIQEILTMVVIGLFCIIFAPLILLSAIIGIFLPLEWIYSDDHFKKCELEHKGFRNRPYHFLDTRGNLESFDHWGAKPLKNSPNRKGHLIRQQKFLERETKAEYMNKLSPTYTQYAQEELDKVNAELSTQMTPYIGKKEEK